MKTVEQLRQEGNVVRVHHVRHLHVPVYNPEFGALDSYLTRGEFTRFAANDEGLKDTKFGAVVDCKGGFTEVTLTTPEGLTYTGKYNFGKKQPFNRKIGLRAALGRVLS